MIDITGGMSKQKEITKYFVLFTLILLFFKAQIVRSTSTSVQAHHVSTVDLVNILLETIPVPVQQASWDVTAR